MITTVLPFSPFLPNGTISFWRRRWLAAYWKPMNVYASKITLAELPTDRATPCDKMQKPATALLRDGDLAVQIAARASRILGLISRHLMAQILRMICYAARASRPGFAVGVLRVSCTGMCKAKRFHVDNEERTCRVGCPDEHDCLSQYNKCPLLSNIFVTVWKNAGVHFREDQLFHDFIAQTLLRILQCGIVVMGVIDASVHAHHYHRHSANNPGNFGDCMEGRIRLVTAVTPTYAHAYQSLCQTGRAVHHQKFRLPASKARNPNLPSSRTTTLEKGNDFQEWAIYTDGGTRVSEGDISAGWGAVARSLHGRLCVMFGPVITTDAHLACAGAWHHCNNTAQLEYHWGASPGCPKRVFSTILGTRPAFAWAVSNHARTSLWSSPASISITKSNYGYEWPCSTSTVMRRIPGTNVQTMLLLLVHTVFFKS